MTNTMKCEACGTTIEVYMRVVDRIAHRDCPEHDERGWAFFYAV